MNQANTFKILLFILSTFILVSSIRSQNNLGIPGPDYWQNQADYQISVTLDVKNHSVTGEVQIKYTNNSPFDLNYLWLHLDQNRFNSTSRGALINNEGGRHEGSLTNGIDIKSVEINQDSSFRNADFHITDSRLQIRLENPITSDGTTVDIKLSFQFTIPEYGADRTGRINLKNGWIYEVAHWYPRMAVLDEAGGWDTAPYLGAGEFYCEFGNFAYEITLPSDFVVVGSGTLVNPEEVLNETALKRLQKAKTTEQTVFIIEPDEVGKKRFTLNKPSLTWRFQMDQSRDVAWACSKGFIWDAATAHLPDSKEVLVMSVYPSESQGQQAWGKATAYGKEVLEYYSQKWSPYPYSTLVNVAGIVGGMEYPGLHFTKFDRGENALWRTLDHEVAHNWFPMMVGSNERQHAWMDEGFVTFMGYYSAQAMQEGSFASFISNLPYIYSRMPNWLVNPVITAPDKSQSISFSDVVYFKPAVALLVLREYVLGGDRFDYAFRQYIKAWAYKHPTPVDFFNCMENASGEDLDWFWNSWFYSIEKLDQAVDIVVNEDKSTLVIIKNMEGMPLPVELMITYADGMVEKVRLPAEIWFKGSTWKYQVEGEKQISSVELDPRKLLPDINRENNVWMKKN